MTKEERNNKLKHFITCLKCEVSGKHCDVNCSKQYDAGNMGEIIENLEAISKALEQESRKDEVILTKEEYGELVSSEFDNGYAKGYREVLEQEPTTKNDCAEQNGCITCSLDDGDDCCRKLYEESMQEQTDNNGFIDDRVIRDFENRINSYEEDYKFSKEEIINILERYELKYKGSRND